LAAVVVALPWRDARRGVGVRGGGS
jgi:hypothetical protein